MSRVFPGVSEVVASKGLFSLALLGFLASLVTVAGGSLAGAASSGSGFVPWGAPNIPVEPAMSLVPALIGYFGGLVVLFRAWLLLRRSHLGDQAASSLAAGAEADLADRSGAAKTLAQGSSSSGPGVPLRAVVLIAVIWALPMLLGPPLGSRDVYAYGSQGRLAEQGFDVYSVGPAALGSQDPILDPVDPLYRETPVLYGPTFVSLSSVGASMAGDSSTLAVAFYRLLAVGGLVMAGFGIFDIAKSLGRDPIDALILSVANPLVLLHLVSGAHNDALMLGVLLAGIAIGLRMERPYLAVVVCTVAASIKLPALLAVAFIGWPWTLATKRLNHRARRLVGVGAVSLTTLGLAGQLTGWGWSWVKALAGQEHVEAYLSITTLVGGGLSYVPGLEFDQVLPITRLVGVIMAIGLTSLLLLRRPVSWVSALAWSFLVWAVLHPTTQPWYLTWGMMVLAASASGRRNRLYVAGSAVGLLAVAPVGPQLGAVLLDSSTSIGLAIATGVLGCLTLSIRPPTQRQVRADSEAATISVIVPTRNEELNVEPFVNSLHHVVDQDVQLRDRSVEILFVDDSEDNTPQRISALAARYQEPNRLVTSYHRQPSQRWGGLGGAVVDGCSRARGNVIVVMDGDLQHPADRVPHLIEEIDNGAELAVASRRLGEGSGREGLTSTRYYLSRLTTGLAKVLFPRSVGRVSDPLSGFFAFQLDRVDLAALQPDGFKILVELLATHSHLAVREVAFTFRGRLQGMSKASASEGLRFLGHLLDLRIRLSRLWGGARLPQRYFSGELVGSKTFR